MQHSTILARLAGVAAAAAALAGTGCGQDGSQEPAREGTRAEDAQLALARCLREQGLDVPDSQPGRPVQITPGAGTDEATVRRAQDRCRPAAQAAGPGTFSPEQQEAAQDALLRFSRCMRERGVKLPDPTVGAGGDVRQALPDGITPGDPRFERAREACEQHLDAAGLPGRAP